ncbi:Lrp/AsnC family transcriptional regulator [Streptomyces sp. NPDC002285]
MDKVDRHILQLLQQDGRMSNADLAEQVGLSASPCLRRVRQLEEQGVIRSYRAMIDGVSVGRGFQAFVSVIMDRTATHTISLFEQRLAELPEVVEAHRFFGVPDYLLRIVVADLAAYERFYAEVLTALPGIARITSMLAMKQIKEDQGVQIGTASPQRRLRP